MAPLLANRVASSSFVRANSPLLFAIVSSMPPVLSDECNYSSRTSVDAAADTLAAVARVMKSDAFTYAVGRVLFESGSPSSVDHFDAGLLLSEEFRAAVASFPGLPSNGYGGSDGIVCPPLEKEETFRSLAERSSASPLRLTAVFRQLLVNIDRLFFRKEWSNDHHCYRRRLGADSVDWAGVRSMMEDPSIVDALVHPDATRFISSIRNSGNIPSGMIGDICGDNFAEFILLTWVPTCDERPIVSSLIAFDQHVITSTGPPSTVFDRASSDSADGHLAAFFSSVVAARLSINTNEVAARSLLYRFLRDRYRFGSEYHNGP